MVHFGEDLCGQRNWRRGRQHSINAAARAESSNTVFGAARLDLPSVDPILDFSWTEELPAIEACSAIATLHELTMMIGVPMDAFEIGSTQHRNTARYNARANLRANQITAERSETINSSPGRFSVR